MPPILYSFRRCPYAIRARLALAVSNTTVEHREILLRDKPKSMLAYSPKGTVPVLVLRERQTEHVIDESRDVMMWALEHRDPENWLMSDPALAQELIDRNDGVFKPILDKYKYHSRHPERTKTDYLNDARPILEDLNHKIQHAGYLNGSNRSLADAAIFPFIRQFYFSDPQTFDALGLYHLQHWLKSWLESPLFGQVMQKHPLHQDATAS